MAKKSGGDESKNKITVGVVSKNNPFSSRRFVVFVVVVLLVLVIAAVLIISLTNNKSNSTVDQSRSNSNPQKELGVVPGAPLTKEQKREMTAVKRVDGVITRAGTKSIVLTLENGDELKLNVQSNTVYSSGTMGYPAESSVVKVGHKAVLTYDSLGNKLKSIWVDYDK